MTDQGSIVQQEPGPQNSTPFPLWGGPCSLAEKRRIGNSRPSLPTTHPVLVARALGSTLSLSEPQDRLLLGLLTCDQRQGEPARTGPGRHNSSSEFRVLVLERECVYVWVCDRGMWVYECVWLYMWWDYVRVCVHAHVCVNSLVHARVHTAWRGRPDYEALSFAGCLK